MSRRLYDALAPLYDRWQSADGTTPFSQLVLPKLDAALARHARPSAAEPVTSFVDLGCATGVLLLELRRRHPLWRLTGVDDSPAMLAVARGKPDAQGVGWSEGQLGQPIAGAPFDAAGCFYDTLNHLPDVQALGRALRGIATALRPGGLFIFDVTNKRGFESWWRGRNDWRGADWQIAIELSYDPALRRGQADVTIDRRDESRVTQTLVEHCFSEPDIEAALAGAGLETVSNQRWSPFDIDAYGKTWWISRSRQY